MKGWLIVYKVGQEVKLLSVMGSLLPVRDYYSVGEVGVVTEVDETRDSIRVRFAPNNMSKRRLAHLMLNEVEVVA